MDTILVGFFENREKAEQVRQELLDYGMASEAIEVALNPEAQEQVHDQQLEPFFENLFGIGLNQQERELYTGQVVQGRVLVTVRTEQGHIDDVVQILNDNGALDIEQEVDDTDDFAGSAETFPQDPGMIETLGDVEPLEQAQQPPVTVDTELVDDFVESVGQNESESAALAIPVIEEDLQIGKRVVQRGAVRIHTRLVEKPVTETVSLKQEQVTIERRPVDRPVTRADLEVLPEGDITFTERAEEPVISKEARVVEEVIVSKDTQEYQEIINDSVLRSEVEVRAVNDPVVKPLGKHHHRKVS